MLNSPLALCRSSSVSRAYELRDMWTESVADNCGPCNGKSLGKLRWGGRDEIYILLGERKVTERKAESRRAESGTPLKYLTKLGW